jgi:hypothetical protein
MNLLKKFYAGDIILWKSYWLVGVLGSIVAGAIAGLIGGFTGIDNLTKIIYSAWMIIVIVGTWKSSDKYKGPKYWSILAKIGVIVGTIQVLSSFSQY